MAYVRSTLFAEADVDDQLKKAFDFAADLAKQLITLATGIITITITFAKDFLPQTPNAAVKHWAIYAWVALLASVVCGLCDLLPENSTDRN